MTADGCTRIGRRRTLRGAAPAPVTHRVPPRVTAKARAAFAWRIIELRLDQILADEETAAPR